MITRDLAEVTYKKFDIILSVCESVLTMDGYSNLNKGDFVITCKSFHYDVYLHDDDTRKKHFRDFVISGKLKGRPLAKAVRKTMNDVFSDIDKYVKRREELKKYGKAESTSERTACRSFQESHRKKVGWFSHWIWDI